MNFFIGSLYGNYQGYQYVKEQLNLKKNDKLWILGDVWDGNDENPEDCVKIITDIARSPNIDLILGDHEYMHIMRYLSIENKAAFDAWTRTLNSLSQSGRSLMQFLDHMLGEDTKKQIFSYLINTCDLTRLLKIGGNYFYLVHGFPAQIKDQKQHSLTKWQYDVTISEPDFQNRMDYLAQIISDPTKEVQDNKMYLNHENCFVICAHKDISQHYPANNGVICKSGVFVIGNDASGEQIPFLGIDAAGYFFNNITCPDTED